MSKIWFITGASRGFGRTWTEAALERGDSVVATAHDTATLTDLVDRFGDRVLPLRLDVTDRAAAFEVVAKAHSHFGRLDVIVNNAGYGLLGAVEELGEDDLRRIIDTNVFGAIWVTQAAIPFLREQRSGHILQVSSIGGITAYPYVGGYNASKWALEGISQALAGELAPFGIKVTLIEPDSFATGFGATASFVDPNPAYDPLRASLGATTSSAHCGPAATRTPPRGPCSNWSTSTSRRCANSSAASRWRPRPRITKHAWRPGGRDRISRCGPAAVSEPIGRRDWWVGAEGFEPPTAGV